MQVTVVGDVAAANRYAGAIQDVAVDVAVQPDPRVLLRELQSLQESRIALVVVGPRPMASLEVVRRIRKLPSSPRVHVLVAGRLSEEFLSAAYSAGADGDIREPLGRGLLLARVEGMVRMVQHRDEVMTTANVEAGEAPVAGRNAPGAEAPRSQPDVELTPIEGILAQPAWRQARETLATATGQFLGIQVGHRDLMRGEGLLGFGSGILLSNVQTEVELRVGVAADKTSAEALAVHLFGEGMEELAADVLGEVSNILMGTMKRTYGECSIPFTGGLPQTVEVERVLRPEVTYEHQQVFTLTLASARLVIHMGLRSTANAVLPVAKLREGMVVARDVYNARGLLLINGGTRLSLAMLEKLHRVMPRDHEVEVQAGTALIDAA